jgi:peroxiredoxin Q/BCP
MPISNGISAPEFSLPDETGKVHSLAEYRGHPVVLYFYPKDDTPGCATEACNFRDGYGQYAQAGITILGVSPDSSASHARFKTKYSLPFPLLADEGHKVCELYQVWGTKKNYGREYQGVLRTTFLIDENGMIVHVFKNVKPAGHSAEVLEQLQVRHK